MITTQFQLSKYISKDIRHHFELTAPQHHTLLALSFYMNKHDNSKVFTAWPTLDQLAQDTGLGKATVQRALAKLKENKILHIKKTRQAGKRHSNSVYTFIGWPTKADKTEQAPEKPEPVIEALPVTEEVKQELPTDKHELIAFIQNHPTYKDKDWLVEQVRNVGRLAISPHIIEQLTGAGNGQL